MTDREVTLWVADDDPEIALVIAGIGKSAGFLVNVITDPTIFTNLGRQRLPDVLVLDLQMPTLDGLQVLRLLADREAETLVLLITGLDQRTASAAEQYGRGRNLRMLSALQKPFTPDELLERFAVARAQLGPLTPKDLERAIAERQLLVYYQPTIKRTAAGAWEILAVEALLRWNHPQRGLLRPDAFLEMSEKSGLIAAMTDHVLARGIEQQCAWRTHGIELGLRVNVPARLITDVAFPDRLEALLQEVGVDAAGLTLEITETAMLTQSADTMDIMTRLRLKQINLAIDDFGIGYSSLTQLFRMPFNEMKIDKSLVLRAPQEREAGIMVKTLIDLAHKLRLIACAEGVETAETLSFLAEAGCDGAQGYFISPPVPAQEIPEVLAAWHQQRRQVAG